MELRKSCEWVFGDGGQREDRGRPAGLQGVVGAFSSSAIRKTNRRPGRYFP